MGTSGWKEEEYKTYSRSISTKSVNQVYSSTKVKAELDPKKIRIKENSLIWATVRLERKLVLPLYPSFAIKIKTIIGFPIKTKIDRIIAGKRITLEDANTRFEPSTTKNNTIVII